MPKKRTSKRYANRKFNGTMSCTAETRAKWREIELRERRRLYDCLDMAADMILAGKIKLDPVRED